MKSYKYIIAALFVVAIGVGIFISCEKESINENTLTSNSNKIQKEQQGVTYTMNEYREINGKCYHVTGKYLVWEDVYGNKYISSGGLIYTEIDCVTMLALIAVPLEFAFEPEPEVEFNCEADYIEPDNYNFTVISGGETLTIEELNLFFQDALVTIYYEIN